jgi:hypothetical protein
MLASGHSMLPRRKEQTLEKQNGFRLPGLPKGKCSVIFLRRWRQSVDDVEDVEYCMYKSYLERSRNWNGTWRSLMYRVPDPAGGRYSVPGTPSYSTYSTAPPQTSTSSAVSSRHVGTVCMYVCTYIHTYIHTYMQYFGHRCHEEGAGACFERGNHL